MKFKSFLDLDDLGRESSWDLCVEGHENSQRGYQDEKIGSWVRNW